MPDWFVMSMFALLTMMVVGCIIAVENLIRRIADLDREIYHLKSENKIHLINRSEPGCCGFDYKAYSFDVVYVLDKLIKHLGLKIHVKPSANASIRFEENE